MAEVATQRTIARNRKARFDYFLSKNFEAGLALEGWEIKSLRAGRGQIADAYVTIRHREAFLVGAVIAPLASASSHVTPVPDRERKLLLHAREIAEIAQAVRIRGKSCVATALYWKGPYVKCEVAIATGKRQYDKRQAIREREWLRQKQRAVRDRERES